MSDSANVVTSQVEELTSSGGGGTHCKKAAAVVDKATAKMEEDAVVPGPGGEGAGGGQEEEKDTDDDVGTVKVKGEDGDDGREQNGDNGNEQISVIWSVNFSTESRLAILKDILTHADDSPVAACQVEDCWREALAGELPEGNWLAVWDPEAAARVKKGVSSQVEDGDDEESRSAISKDELTCVDVEGYRLEDLQAEVALLTVPKGMEAELEHQVRDQVPKIVSLTDVFPIFESKRDGENEEVEERLEREVAEGAACILDHLRFFYAFIWRPWDEDSESEDFVEEHLADRVALYEELRRGGGKSVLWDRVQALIHEFVRVRDEMDQLSPDGGDDESLQGEDLERFLVLEKLEEDILSKAKILENPSLRKAAENRVKRERREGHPGVPVCRYVMPAGNISFAREFLDKVVEVCNGREVTEAASFPSAAKAIGSALAGDVIALPPGPHYAEDLGELEEGGGALVGVGGVAELCVQFGGATEVTAGKVETANVRVSFMNEDTKKKKRSTSSTSSDTMSCQ